MTPHDQILAVLSEDTPTTTQSVARQVKERWELTGKRLRNMEGHGLVERTQYGTADRPAMWVRTSLGSIRAGSS